MKLHPQPQSPAQLLPEIQKRIVALGHAALVQRPVTLIAVSKTQNTEAITVLLEAGQKIFGENRVQEAAEKWPGLQERYIDSELHLIGPLQTNKVKEALSLFNVIQTIDRPALIDAIIKEREKQTLRCRRFFMQVNTGEEEQKAGVSPQQAESLAGYAHQRGLPIEGLMCIPPAGQSPAPHFALLRTLAGRLGIKYLSME